MDAANSGPTARLELLLDAVLLAMNAVERRLVPLQLGFAQARSLTVMLLAPQPLTPTEIAGLMLQEVQSISTLLSRMESRGLVFRKPHPLDRRSTFFTLTPEGETAAQACLDVFCAVAAELRPLLGSPAARDMVQYDLEQLRDRALSLVPVSVSAYRRRVDAFWHDQ